MSIYTRQGPPPIWVDKQPYFLLGKSGDQTVSTVTLTKVTWETVVVPATFFDVDLSNNRVNIVVGGNGQFGVRFASTDPNWTNTVSYHLNINGNSVEELTAERPFGDGISMVFSDVPVVPGDFVEIFVFNNDTSSADWQATGTANALDSGFEGRILI